MARCHSPTIPTPYQIFGQKKDSPYSKRKFYELVKLYHPDRHDYGSSGNLPSYTTKLERYRLIVAANDILSNPVKRAAYDRYGSGWNGQPDALSPEIHLIKRAHIVRKDGMDPMGQARMPHGKIGRNGTNETQTDLKNRDLFRMVHSCA